MRLVKVDTLTTAVDAMAALQRGEEVTGCAAS
jgi:hypothetical protein